MSLVSACEPDTHKEQAARRIRFVRAMLSRVERVMGIDPHCQLRKSFVPPHSPVLQENWRPQLTAGGPCRPGLVARVWPGLVRLICGWDVPACRGLGVGAGARAYTPAMSRIRDVVIAACGRVGPVRAEGHPPTLSLAVVLSRLFRVLGCDDEVRLHLDD